MQTSSDTGSRRTDIDLLRAVAVLAVIFFHFEVPGFNGGFLGVDIFFVISGYLITLHIQQQLTDSSFSFIYFYVRRIRRLFPALIATLVLSSLAALFILPKTLLVDYSHSQIASSIYLSNVYFWSIADYFDTESILKPLLHTWSLSVEEQFYLVWPLFLVMTFSKGQKIAIGIAAVLSLLAAELTFNLSASAVFYLFPFRIFEFSIGALMCGRSLKTLSGPVRNLLLFASCLSIALSLYLATKHTRNPGILTVPICLGTAIIIGLSHPWMNCNNKVTTIFLRIGLISYSAYLVHWPLLVFYKIYNPGPLSISAILTLVSATYLLAEIFYIYIEKPTSKISIWDRKLLFLSSLPLVLLWAVTFDQLLPRVYRVLNPQEYTVAHVLDSILDRRLVLKEIEGEIEEENASAILVKQRKILVVGDSHGVDTTLALQLLLAKTNSEVELAHSICDPLTLNSIDISLGKLYESAAQEKTRNPDYCEIFHANFLENLINLSPDLIVFSEAWRPAAIPYLAQTITEIKNASTANILILGRTPQFSPHPNIIFRDLKQIDQINKAAWDRRYKIFDGLDEQFVHIAKQTNSYFISKNELVCPERNCELLIDSEFGYVDDQHWSIIGLKYYGRRLINHDSFKAANN